MSTVHVLLGSEISYTGLDRAAIAPIAARFTIIVHYCEPRFSNQVKLRSRSLERRRQRTVELRVNARLEHLFLAFENNCVKLNT